MIIFGTRVASPETTFDTAAHELFHAWFLQNARGLMSEGVAYLEAGHPDPWAREPVPVSRRSSDECNMCKITGRARGYDWLVESIAAAAGHWASAREYGLAFEEMSLVERGAWGIDRRAGLGEEVYTAWHLFAWLNSYDFSYIVDGHRGGRPFVAQQGPVPGAIDQAAEQVIGGETQALERPLLLLDKAIRLSFPGPGEQSLGLADAYVRCVASTATFMAARYRGRIRVNLAGAHDEIEIPAADICSPEVGGVDLGPCSARTFGVAISVPPGEWVVECSVVALLKAGPVGGYELRLVVGGVEARSQEWVRMNPRQKVNAIVVNANLTHVVKNWMLRFRRRRRDQRDVDGRPPYRDKDLSGVPAFDPRPSPELLPVSVWSFDVNDLDAFCGQSHFMIARLKISRDSDFQVEWSPEPFEGQHTLSAKFVASAEFAASNPPHTSSFDVPFAISWRVTDLRYGFTIRGGGIFHFHQCTGAVR